MKKFLVVIILFTLLFSLNLNVSYANEDKKEEEKEKAETGLLAGPAEITVNEILKEGMEIELKELTVTNTGMYEQEVEIKPEGNLIVKDNNMVLKQDETKKTMISIKVKEGNEGKITDYINVNTVSKNGYQEINLKLKVNYEVEKLSFFEEYKVHVGIGILFTIILLLIAFSKRNRKKEEMIE